MRRFFLIGLCLLAACGSDSSTAPQQSIAGTWTLRTINGTSLPYIITQSGADKAELMSDAFTISGTGSFTQTSVIRYTTNGVATTQSSAEAGSYTINGTAVTLHFNSDGSTVTASWSGNTLTATAGGLVGVYGR